MGAGKDMTTAGIVIIGNEILSGAVADANTGYLAQELFARGVSLREVAVVPDDLETIAGKVSDFSARFDVVFTTGGIGPTHDDVTFAAVGLAFNLGLEEHPELVRIARSKFKQGLNNAARKLTIVPATAELLPGGRFLWPPVKVKNVVVLPGIPALIRAQMPALDRLLPARRFYVVSKKCYVHEVELAAAAAGTAAEFPDVEVGSYPITETEDRHILVKFTGSDEGRVAAAVAGFVSRLPDQVFRSSTR